MSQNYMSQQLWATSQGSVGKGATRPPFFWHFCGLAFVPRTPDYKMKALHYRTLYLLR